MAFLGISLTLTILRTWVCSSCSSSSESIDPGYVEWKSTIWTTGRKLARSSNYQPCHYMSSFSQSGSAQSLGYHYFLSLILKAKKKVLYCSMQCLFWLNSNIDSLPFSLSFHTRPGPGTNAFTYRCYNCRISQLVFQHFSTKVEKFWTTVFFEKNVNQSAADHYVRFSSSKRVQRGLWAAKLSTLRKIFNQPLLVWGSASLWV